MTQENPGPQQSVPPYFPGVITAEASGLRLYANFSSEPLPVAVDSVGGPPMDQILDVVWTFERTSGPAEPLVVRPLTLAPPG